MIIFGANSVKCDFCYTDVVALFSALFYVTRIVYDE